MNYIAEINSFYDWIEINPVTKCAIALWHALMHINNKASWSHSFTVSIKVLEIKTGFKRTEIFLARRLLASKKRIIWTPQGGRAAARYQLIPFHKEDFSQATGWAESVKGNKSVFLQGNLFGRHEVREKECKNPKKISGVFIPPTLEEVAGYFIEKGLEETEAYHRAFHFYNFYDGKNWMIGKNKMAKWKSAATKSLQWEIPQDRKSYNHPAAGYNNMLKRKTDERF